MKIAYSRTADTSRPKRSSPRFQDVIVRSSKDLVNIASNAISMSSCGSDENPDVAFAGRWGVIAGDHFTRTSSNSRHIHTLLDMSPAMRYAAYRPGGKG